MADKNLSYNLDIVKLSKTKPTHVDITFSDQFMETARDILSVVSLKKMRITGTMSPVGKTDWRLKAVVGATVVQPCVISLNPVRTRVDSEIERNFIHEYNDIEEDSVIEMNGDVSTEPLQDQINLGDITIEAIALALPDYPKAPDVQLETNVFSEPGIEPLTDETSKPFASLANLRDKLNKDAK